MKPIGLFALIGLPYTWKFLWSPLLDRYAMPLLGRRRGWMFAMHIALRRVDRGAGLPAAARTEIWTIAYVAAAVAFFSASLDIAIDAFRRELLPDVELGLGNSIYVNAYRISSLVPGSLSLILADRMPWPSVFVVTALVHAARPRDDAAGPRARGPPPRRRRCATRSCCRSASSSTARAGRTRC